MDFFAITYGRYIADINHLCRLTKQNVNDMVNWQSGCALYCLQTLTRSWCKITNNKDIWVYQTFAIIFPTILTKRSSSQFSWICLQVQLTERYRVTCLQTRRDQFNFTNGIPCDRFRVKVVVCTCWVYLYWIDAYVCLFASRLSECVRYLTFTFTVY